MEAYLWNRHLLPDLYRRVVNCEANGNDARALLPHVTCRGKRFTPECGSNRSTQLRLPSKRQSKARRRASLDDWKMNPSQILPERARSYLKIEISDSRSIKEASVHRLATGVRQGEKTHGWVHFCAARPRQPVYSSHGSQACFLCSEIPVVLSLHSWTPSSLPLLSLSSLADQRRLSWMRVERQSHAAWWSCMSRTLR